MADDGQGRPVHPHARAAGHDPLGDPAHDDHARVHHPSDGQVGHEHAHDHPGGLRGWVASMFRSHSHDAADSIDSALERTSAGIRATKVGLVGLGATALAQVVVVMYTGSTALLADTVHNFSDALTSIPLWIAFVISRRAANRRYTHGYGRAEDLSGLFIVAMIALSAVIVGYESLTRLFDPRPIANVGAVLAAGIIGFAGNEAVAAYRIRVGRRIGSAALVTDGLHARTDGITSLAVVGAALGVMAGLPWADPIVGLLITLVILFILRGAALSVYRRLMDAVEPELVDAAEHALVQVPGVEGIDDLRLRWSGHRLHAEASIVVAARLSVTDGHLIAVHAHHDLLHAVPQLINATIHVSPTPEPAHDPHALLTHHADR